MEIVLLDNTFIIRILFYKCLLIVSDLQPKFLQQAEQYISRPQQIRRLSKRVVASALF